METKSKGTKKFNTFVPLDHPSSLLHPLGRHDGAERKEVEGIDGAFIIDHLLTRAECDHYVRAAEAAGFESVEHAFPSEYRTNDRVMSLVPDAVERSLFVRLAPFLTPSDTLCTPMGPGTEGVWLPVGVNECFKFARYRPGGHFRPHMDGPWVPAAQKASIYTVVIYLNDAATPGSDHETQGPISADQQGLFVGGYTNFLRPKASTSTHESNASSHIKRSQEEHEVISSVKPKAGRALIFKHELLHEGGALLSGVKYILRTELIFERVTSPLTPLRATDEEYNAWQDIERLYDISQRKYEANDSEGFVETYLAAIELQKKHNRASSINNQFRLPPEMVWEIMGHLNMRDVVSVMLANKSFYHLGRISPIWRTQFNSCAKNSILASSNSVSREGEIEGLATVDWYARCKNGHRHKLGKDEVEGRRPGHRRRWTKRNLPEKLLMGETSETGIETIVIDTGSCMTTAGYSGDDAPRARFPSAVARPIRRRGRHSHSVQVGRDSYVGDEAMFRRGHADISFPIEGRRVSNWDSLEKLWFHTFYNELRVAPEEHPVLMTDSIRWSKHEREKMMQILFETFNIPCLYSADQGRLAMFSSGLTTGLSVDMGEQTTDIVPIYEGMPISWAATSLGVGGQDVTNTLVSLLQGAGYRHSIDHYIAADIKHKHCFCSSYPDSDMQASKFQPVSLMHLKGLDYTYLNKLPNELLSTIDAMVRSSVLKRSYEMPDGSTITVNSERFRCSEIYFSPPEQLIARDLIRRIDPFQKKVKPSVEKELIEEESGGLHQKIYSCIQQLPRELRADMWKNIVLSGGGSMLPGLDDRLRQELAYFIESDGDEFYEVNIIGAQERQYAAWRGGSVLGSLSQFQLMWVTRDEYNDQGPRIVHTKCI